MKKPLIRNFFIAISLLFAFVLWTLSLLCIDVQPIGPRDSSVGMATINQFVHKCTGVHMQLYTVTDWLGLVPIVFVLGFAIFGLIQWIQRKHIWMVDANILILGGFYIVTIAAYVFFEYHAINFRPTLINGHLEVSYPSSTTLLVLCVMPTAMLQLHSRIKTKLLRNLVTWIIGAFVVFMVIGRLLSGVHWLSDIIGGILLSSGLVMLYHSAVCWADKR